MGNFMLVEAVVNLGVGNVVRNFVVNTLTPLMVNICLMPEIIMMVGAVKILWVLNKKNIAVEDIIVTVINVGNYRDAGAEN